MKKLEETKVRVGVEQVRCEDCHEYKMAMDVFRQFDWRSDRVIKAINYDREAKEILVNEQAIMRIIEMINPAQMTKKIRLVTQDEFYGKVKK